MSILSWLSDSTIVAFDTETTGLEETDRPFGIAFATKDRAEFYDERVHPEIWEHSAFYFANEKITWIAQNAKFDIRMMGYMHCHIRGPVHDINSLARLERNDHQLYNLAAQGPRIVGSAKDKAVDLYIKTHKLYEVRRDFFGADYKSPRYQDVPQEIMAGYASQDARLTFDLYVEYTKRLDSYQDREIKRGYDGPRAVIQQESDLIPVCYKMERRGLLVDKSWTLAGMYHEQGIIADAKAQYFNLTGTEFVDSAKSIQKNLEFVLPKTDAGNPSLDDEVLDALIARGTPKDVKIGTTVRLIRGYEKRVSTYYKSYLNFMDAQSIIHPTMWIAGTRTGRFSYSDPNFQNMPKEEDSTDTYVIRGCIKPRPGRIFVSMDYSQMEYRMAVAYANQTDVIAKVMSGADFHQATADLLGISRKHAKTLNFAVLYGAGIQKIAVMLGCTVAEAKVLQYKYFAGLPKVEKFIDRVIATGRGQGYVVNWLGRPLYAHKEFCYALPNHLIQGGGADVCKKAMVEIDRELPHIWMVLQVHDQLIFEMLSEELIHVPRLKEIMENVFPEMNGMKLKVDVKYSNKSLAERDMTDEPIYEST